MDITKAQAEKTLQDVDSISRNVREKLRYEGIGAVLTLWGGIWIICFSLTQFLPSIAAWSWLIGNSLGIIGTAAIVIPHSRRKTVSSNAVRQLERKLFLFWLSIGFYGFIWLFLFQPVPGIKVGLFLVTLIMFAYVIMGLWLNMMFMFLLGLIVSLLAIVGYIFSYWLHGYLNLWLGLSGGGALLISGIYLMRRWRL